MSERKKLLEVTNLKKYFPVKSGFLKTDYVRAVEDVSLFIYEGETLGVVGESGCGKTTLGRTILRLIEPSGGRIEFDGEVIYDKDAGVEKQMLPYRSKMQIIFQDPSASLDPRMTVGEIVGEALAVHRKDLKGAAYTDRINELLETVGLNTEHANRFPHEFSGGQQQRIGIARALAVEPDFIVCDEPISALDVSIQSQVVNMLEDLQEEKHLTYLFIAHDISVVRHISDRICVMYLGQTVELAESYELCREPMHPYTQTLLSAVPLPDPDKTKQRERILLEGDIPSPLNPPAGCRFHTRCPYAMDICKEQPPAWKEYGEGHFCACHKVAQENA
ncbi:MAG: ATP-binding cassette domain-containing protein [Lachnospiraceae bacterium]|nr:ATP-binding cassette domain-containing protein [Lachnospiraceae bacterium]